MRLMVVIALVINVFLALSLIFFQATRKTYPGFGLWTTGVSLLGLGYLSLYLRGLIPDSISILVANAAFPLGMVLHLAGMRLFLGLSPISRRWYALPGGVLAAAAVFYYGYDLEAWRTLILSIAISGPHFVMALLILRHPVRPSSMFCGVIGSLLALAGVMILGRGIWSLSEPQFHTLLHSPVQFIFFVSVIVLQLGETLAFMMLNSERVESELVETQTELRMTVNRLQEAVDEQKRVEESLRESEEKYRNLFNNAEVGMFRTRLDGSEVLDTNDKFLLIFSRPREEMQGGPSVIHWVDPSEREEMIRRLNTDGRITDFECKMLNRQGEVRICMTSLRLYREQGFLEGSIIDITERKRAEENLRDSEARLWDLYDNAPNAYFSVGTDGLIRKCNKGAEELLGYPREVLEGKRVLDLYMDSPEGKEKAAKVLQKFISGEQVTSEELQMQKADGSPIWISLSVNALRDADGKVVESRSAVVDITERKNIEEAQRQSEERLRMIYESGMLGMGFCDLDGRVLDANDTYLAMIQCSREDLLNNRINWREITPAEHLPADLNGFDELMSTGRCTPYEKEYLLPNGTRVPVVIGGALISGSSSTAIAFALDITERKQAEEALRASEEKYRLLVDKAQEAIFVVQDTVFRFANPRLEEIVGFSSDELIGKSFGGFVHPDDRKTVIENHYRRLNGEVFPSRYEIRIIDKQNIVKWVEIDSVVIDWEGRPAAMVFLTDTSYRKLAEEAAVQTERLKAIADLSGGVAHHFNNLLQIVMAGASLSLADLESGDLTGIKTTLEQILEGASRGSEMVKRLQTFANIRADITEEEAAIFDIAATARNAAEISKPLWKAEPEKKGIKVNLLLDLEEGCLVQGKENEMFEVLVSLISNAAEALPAGGAIEVKAGKEADEVVVRIRDTGIGITEDDLPRVFQPFWSTRGVGIGKGMGLAVTHGLVKRHGGTISVQSKAGEGTTFTIRLPLAPAPVTKSEQPPISTSKASLTILIIEDELHIATLLERILTKAGHRVFKTLSGEEGLAVAHKEQVDLVICDLGMPGMNGWDVGKAIRSIYREKGITKPPFVLLTGWGGQELETEKIAESGTDAVVAKPIDTAALLATVQEIAERFNVKSLEK